MKKYLYILTIATVSVFTYGCGSKGPDKKAQLAELRKQQAEISAQIKTIEADLVKENGDQSKGKTQMVEVSNLQPAPFSHFVEVQGRVDSDKNIMLTPRNQGIVNKIYVKKGQQVRRGQLLASQDAGIILKSIEQAKTGVNFATTMFDKQKRLWEQKIGSEVQYLQSKNTKESAEAQLASLQEQYALTQFIAPFDGVVDEIYLREGESPSPLSGGIRVISPSDFKVIAEIAEFYIGKVNPGADVKINFPDLSKEITAKVTTVSRVINSINRTFTVEISIPNNSDLKANMLAYVSIQDYKNPKALTIPINAIQETDEGKYVYVAENNKAKKKTIKVGQTYKGEAEVKDGLLPGEQVITIGQNDLVDGQGVEISKKG